MGALREIYSTHRVEGILVVRINPLLSKTLMEDPLHLPLHLHLHLPLHLTLQPESLGLDIHGTPISSVSVVLVGMSGQSVVVVVVTVHGLGCNFPQLSIFAMRILERFV